MRERPIIFSSEMVKAILDGRKGQTRRVIKDVPGIMMDGENVPEAIPPLIEAYKNAWIKTCPYGQPGDRLWVRETWFIPLGGDPSDILFRADGISGIHDWRPSIFMPRWASRILLEITDVRVEKLQEISEEDARAEGLQDWYGAKPAITNKGRFHAFWDSLNKKRGFGWETNPWVYVISFKRI